MQVRARRIVQSRWAGQVGRVPVGADPDPAHRLSERAVRTCLGRLEHNGLIRPCDPAVVAAKIKRAHRRPRARISTLHWSGQTDFDEADIQSPEYQFTGLRREYSRNEPQPTDQRHQLE
jgi:hypothetical protein